jgi:hypothetical protein
MIILGVLLVLGALWFVYQVVTAPIGYEDKNGFHYGNPKVK